MDGLEQLYRAFPRDPEAAALILKTLLAQECASVRLCASVQCLRLGLHAAQAAAVLELLARDGEDRRLRFEAEVCLAQWRNGELH